MTTRFFRALDHLVLPVRDLEAAAEAYRALGFQVGARNRHPWGTENRIVQFRSTFLEPIVFGADAQKPVRTAGDFSFSAQVADFQARFGEGFAMLALDSGDAKADQLAFDAAGIGGFAPFFFERKGKRPDGSESHVAFSLAYAASSAIPDAGFFVCQQHNPESFWNPAFQVHANGVTDVTGVVMVADNPSDHHIFLSAFAGVRDIRSSSAGVTIPMARGGVIECLTPVAYAQRFGEPAPALTSPRFVAFRVATTDMAAAWQHAAPRGARRIGETVVTSVAGTVIAFEAVV